MISTTCWLSGHNDIHKERGSSCEQSHRNAHFQHPNIHHLSSITDPLFSKAFSATHIHDMHRVWNMYIMYIRMTIRDRVWEETAYFQTKPQEMRCFCFTQLNEKKILFFSYYCLYQLNIKTRENWLIQLVTGYRVCDG